MTRNLPEMGDWDAVFDETYLQTYVHSANEERSRVEALGAARLANLEPNAEVLDCPTGFGRHAIVLAAEGYRVTGLDRSPTLLAEAESRRGMAEWPRLVRGTTASSRSLTGASTRCSTFSSLGYLERHEDVGVLREFRRVLRSGRTLVMETAHRDGFARMFQPFGRRTWERLPDGTLYLEERTPDWIAGTIDTYRLIVAPSGERVERPYRLHVYSAREWADMLREAGFSKVDAFGGWDESPPAPDAWRLILRAALIRMD